MIINSYSRGIYAKDAFFFGVLEIRSAFVLWLVINALIIENCGRFELLRLIEEYENVLIKSHEIKNRKCTCLCNRNSIFFFFNSQSVLHIIFEFKYK